MARTWSHLILEGKVASHSERSAKAFDSGKLKHSGWGPKIHSAPEFLSFERSDFHQNRSAKKEPTYGLHLQFEGLEEPLNLPSRLRVEKERSPGLV